MSKNLKDVIICIDDDQTVLNALYTQMFKHLGTQYQIELTESTSEAEKLISELQAAGHAIPLVICDQIMQEKPGDVFLAELHEKQPQIIKIMLTGQASIASVIHVINDANIFRYICKPWEEDDLILAIKKALNEYYLAAKSHLQIKTFEKFVPKEFISLLSHKDITDINLGDHIEKKMTILFSDIRSFVSISEKMTPEMSFDFINKIIGMIAPIITAHGGFIDKYIGDAIMALFEFPDNALDAAIEMQKKIKESDAKIKIGIGLNLGPLMLGIIGIESRLQGTVMSDSVNTANRLESVTSLYETDIIFSKEVLEQLSEKNKYHFRYIGKIKVKGREQLVEMYELLNSLDENTLQKKLESRDDFEEGVKFFIDGEFIESSARFNRVLKKFPQDKAAKIYFEQCIKEMSKWTFEGKE